MKRAMLMHLSTIAMTALLLLSPNAARAAATCGLTLSAFSVNLVWTRSLPTQQIAFTVNKSKNPDCSYFVTFSKGSAANYNARRLVSGASTLGYQLYKESSLTNILKELPDVTTQNEVITGSFGTGKNLTQSRTFYLDIPLGPATTPKLKPSGTYTDTLVMKVYQAVVPPDPAEHTISVNISTNMPKNIEISLVNSGSAFDPTDTSQTMDFGSLSSGQSRGFDMRVLSNAGFSISFSSQNNGKLKHTNPAVTTTIPYDLTVNSSLKNLGTSSTSPVTVATGAGQTGLDGAANPVAVTIGSVADKMAGAYSDVITVTAATVE